MGIGDCTTRRIACMIMAFSFIGSASIYASVLPFTENFEGFTNGDDVNGSNGWLAAPGVAEASNAEANGGTLSVKVRL